ncbi:MAG: hypothetical protein D6705_02450 [Deltaproteobacteria bacterium]|nr:MAG: hypothetical protein D6705_02450 [Deltaproteobacteria bacterium]
MMALGLGLGTVAGCDPHAQDEDADSAGDVSGGGAEETGGSACEEPPAEETGGEAPACNLVPEEGPALLDFGRCELMGTGEAIGACGNTGIHRRCDAAFLAWCNEQGGDVSACAEEETFDATPSVPCGTGPNAIACDLPFKDNCDSLDGTFVCFNRSCTLGVCIPPVLHGCTTSVPCGDGELGCKTPKDAVESQCTSGVNGAGQNFVHCTWIEAGETKQSGGACDSSPTDGN